MGRTIGDTSGASSHWYTGLGPAGGSEGGVIGENTALKNKTLTTKDIIESGETGTTGTSQSFGLMLQDGRITIGEFAKLVQTALDKAKETAAKTAEQDAKINKSFRNMILDEFRAMQEIKAAISEIGKQAEQLYGSARNSTSFINNKMSNVYQSQTADRQAVMTYAQAVSNYKNPNSPDYHNQAKLDQAKETYNNYVDARDREIDQYDTQVDEYNTSATGTNKKLGSLSDILATFSFVAKGKKLEFQEAPVSHYQGSRLQKAVGNDFTAQIRNFSFNEVKQTSKFSMNEFMATYWGPVESLFLQQMVALAKTVDFHLNLEAFQKMRGTLKGAQPQSMLMLNLVSSLLTASMNAKDQALGLPFQTSFTNRLAARALIADIALQMGILIPQTVQAEIQHAVIAALSNSSLFTSSAMNFLGDQFGNLNLSDSAYAAAMSFAFAGRIGAMVEGSVLRRSALDAINQDPALSALPLGDKMQLARQMVSAMQLSLLNSAVMNMAITLGIPGLVSQVMFNALLSAGVDSFGLPDSINSALTDRTSSLAASGEIAKFLVDKGFSSEFASQVVNDAVSKAQSFGPYATVQDFISNLSMQLQGQGLDERTANTLSIDYTASILGNNPTALLGGNELDTAVTLGVISKDVFLSTAAKNSVLAGLDPGLGSFYEKAVGDLLNASSPSSIAAAFSSGGSADSINLSLPPVTLAGVRNSMFANLVAQGVDVGSSWQIANNFTDLVKGGEPFAMAMQVNPYAIGFLQSQLIGSLEERGFSDARGLAGVIMNASFSSPSSLNSSDTASSVITAIDTSMAHRVGILQYGIASALAAKGFGADQSAGIASAVLASGATDSVSLTASLRDALINSGLGLSPGDAQDLAGAILNSNVLNKDVSIGSALLSSDFTAGIVTKALIDQGIDPIVAGKIAESTAASLISNAAPFASIDSALAAVLTQVLINNLSLDPIKASALAESIDLGTSIGLNKAASDLASGLLNAGFADNLNQASAIASSLIGEAMRVPNALSSDLAFKAALITAASLTLDVDSNVARDLIAKLTVSDLVLKDVLINELVKAFQSGGYPDLAIAEAMASSAAAGLFQNTAGYTPQIAFQNAFGSHIMGTLGVTASVAAELARGVEINNILILGALQSDISSAFMSTKLYDQAEAARLTENLIGLILQDPGAFSSEVSFRDSAFNNLFINMGINSASAQQIAQNLALEGIFNRELIKESLVLSLIAAGYSPVQAEIKAILGAETFFLINTPQLDLPAASGIAQAIALSGSFGFKELSNALSNILVDRGLVADATLRQNLAEQIAAQVIVNPSTHKDAASFRDAIRDALLSAVGTMDRETASAIADQIPITDALRMDILQQAIIYAGVTYGFF